MVGSIESVKDAREETPRVKAKLRELFKDTRDDDIVKVLENWEKVRIHF